ncbi:cytochrome P450 [Catenaria anguillulae PL171]|uniref:Cytochrome P450 n=1 Tax=Catenaria anguillulae PL171 TaxID=765915 RepID=A0A1Y2HPM0_9FUNG|nr:cytochrome P450 [Catenaria anguillulae PL171]
MDVLTRLDARLASLSEPLLTALTSIGLLTTATLLLYHMRKSSSHDTKPQLPPSPPGAWPFLGHLPLLAYHASKLGSLFASLASTLGPVYMLRLGAQRMLVVNSDTLARESLLRNGKAYAGRLLTAPFSVISEDGNDLAFAPYGEKWRTIRRAAHKILTPAAVDAMDMRLELEADRLVAHLADVGTAQIDNMFQRGGVTFERLDDPELVALLERVTETVRLMAVGGVDEYVPDSGGFGGPMSCGAWSPGRLEKRWAQSTGFGERTQSRAARDLCYAEELLVQAMEADAPDGDSERQLSMQQIKLVMADLLLAGMETTAGTLMWIAILLVNHPDVQRKAYDSLVDYCGIDPGTGKVRVPTLADSTQLPYIRAIVKETLRLIPIAPLGLPRATIEDTHIAGYHVPKGTQVVYNIDAIHEGMYPESKGGNEFRPERWLDEGFADGRGKGGVEVPDGIFTFGLGRRQCPGMHLATRELCLVTARLLAAFELKSGEPGKKELTAERQFGLTAAPKNGAVIEFVPRLK